MSANTHIPASAVRPFDRFRSLGDLVVTARTNHDNGTTTLEFSSDATLVIASDNTVKVWRPFAAGDLVSWITSEWVESEVPEGDLEDDYGFEKVTTVHKGRVNNVTISEETGHAVINVLTGYDNTSHPEYADFTSRQLRHATFAEDTATAEEVTV